MTHRHLALFFSDYFPIEYIDNKWGEVQVKTKECCFENQTVQGSYLHEGDSLLQGHIPRIQPQEQEQRNHKVGREGEGPPGGNGNTLLHDKAPKTL